MRHRDLTKIKTVVVVRESFIEEGPIRELVDISAPLEYLTGLGFD